MPKVIGMHFVCRDDLNVTDHGNGTFDTGSWYMALKPPHSLARRSLLLDPAGSVYGVGGTQGLRDLRSVYNFSFMS